MTRRHRAEWMMSLVFALSLMAYVLYYGWAFWFTPMSAPAAAPENPEQAFMQLVHRHEIGAVRYGSGGFASARITREFLALSPDAQQRTLSTVWHYVRSKQPDVQVMDVMHWSGNKVGTFDGRTLRRSANDLAGTLRLPASP